MKLPQLSLRDLFWLVALVALACGWWVERSKAADERGANKREIVELLGRIRYHSGDL